ARRHHLARRLLADLKHRLEQEGVVRVELTALLALLDQHADLFRGVNPLELGGGASQAEEADHAMGAPVDEVRERTSDPREEDEWRGDPAAGPLGVSDRPGLGRL